VADAGFVWIIDYDDPDDARRAGATLLASGIVAEVDVVGELHSLSVMEDQVERGCELLGLPVPEVSPTVPWEPSSSDQPAKRLRWRYPRERVPWLVAGYVLVVVLLTIGVFVAAVFVFGGDFGGRTDPRDVDELVPVTARE
jgi:hypothetical protein